MKTHYPNQTQLVGLALRAGHIMRKNFVPGMKCEWKEDHTPLTVSDTLINQMVVNELEREFPHITVTGEEESRISNDGEFEVLLDPIDGTIPFSHGVATSTFCISVLRNRIPIAAVIHDPFLHRTWSAEKGCGTLFNGERVRISDQVNLAKSTVSIMWWNGAIGNLDKVCSDLVKSNAKWINLCSVAITGGLIASSDLEASIFPGEKAWETAAMQLLVEEAGGVATDLFGNKLEYGHQEHKIPGHIMSNGHIHDELVTMVARANRVN